MSERFVSDGWRVPMTWLLAPVALAYAGLYFFYFSRFHGLSGGLSVLGGICFLIMAAALCTGLWQRRRPVVEIDGDFLGHGSIYESAPLQRVRLADIASVRRRPWAQLLLTLHSGERVRVHLSTLSFARRREVEEAIRRRIAAA